ncbi:hypothetical protein Hamer_G024935 [Homarus americanus]|uniref:Uncharacterized protein n=1 Tax=Homarus americanus TaxID=6706 RepID=A0A8J5K0J4_HOMAM|nr:hypothetical protein Hamer_G024935 [Homarus americanus]
MHLMESHVGVNDDVVRQRYEGAVVAGDHIQSGFLYLANTASIQPTPNIISQLLDESELDAEMIRFDRGIDSVKYKRPLLLGGILAIMSIGYTYRLELIGDISKEKEALFQQTDVDGSSKIKNSIRETHLEYFRSLTRDKK